MRFKISPQKDSKNYPTKSEYHLHSNKLIKSVLSIGIGSALVCGTLADDKHKAEDKSTEKKAKNKEKTESMSEKIAKLASELGAEDFKVRQVATIALIELGKKKVDNKQPLKDSVMKEMSKLVKNKDPEVRVRAKKVIDSLTLTFKKAINNHCRINAACVRHVMPVHLDRFQNLQIQKK